MPRTTDDIQNSLHSLLESAHAKMEALADKLASVSERVARMEQWKESVNIVELNKEIGAQRGKLDVFEEQQDNLSKKVEQREETIRKLVWAIIGMGFTIVAGTVVTVVGKIMNKW
jgi:hypothetical protein